MFARATLLAFAAVLPVIDLVFAQPPGVAGQKYALLVGVNEYDNRKLANLNYAERDVTELARVLKTNGFTVTILLGSGTGAAKATRANIEKAVADLLGKVTKRDTLLTAFAGHGEQFKPDGAAQEQPFFCPVDAVPNDAKRLYPFNDLLKKLDTAGAGTNLVLVDACRSVNDANRGTRSGIDGSKSVGLAVGTVVFFACSRDQEARETDKANGGHGVFFHHVIDGLKGGAANKRGQVTWDGLVAHVKDQTAATYPDWFPSVPEKKWQQPQSIGNTSGAVVLISGDMAKKPNPAPAKAPKLNILPDYNYEGEGLRLEGVAPGGVAEKAGMKEGDVIVELGGKSVKTVAGYMTALSAQNSGQVIEVVILRGGKKVTLKVTPQ